MQYLNRAPANARKGREETEGIQPTYTHARTHRECVRMGKKKNNFAALKKEQKLSFIRYIHVDKQNTSTVDKGKLKDYDGLRLDRRRTPYINNRCILIQYGKCREVNRPMALIYFCINFKLPDSGALNNARVTWFSVPHLGRCHTRSFRRVLLFLNCRNRLRFGVIQYFA